MTEIRTSPGEPGPGGSRYAAAGLILALGVSLLGTLGSVYLSVGQGLKACPLCFYQRTFVMAALAVMALGVYADRSRPGLMGLLGMPLAWAGLGVAAFHEYLVCTGVLECPSALFALGSAPAQSLAMFIVLSIVTSATAWAGRGEGGRQGIVALLAAVLLGLLLAWACIASSPPLPPAPKAPYDPVKQPLDTCRPPFRE